MTFRFFHNLLGFEMILQQFLTSLVNLLILTCLQLLEGVESFDFFEDISTLIGLCIKASIKNIERVCHGFDIRLEWVHHIDDGCEQVGKSLFTFAENESNELITATSEGTICHNVERLFLLIDVDWVRYEMSKYYIPSGWML